MSAACAPDASGARWLDLEHRILPPGLPFVVVLGGADPGSTWRRFVLLREGPRNAAVRIRLGTAPEGLRLCVVRTDLDDVATFPGISQLRDSFEAATLDDPAAVPHWRAWAREALTQPGLTAEVGSLLEEIARGCVRL
jgi:hypothetical protein